MLNRRCFVRVEALQISVTTKLSNVIDGDFCIHEAGNTCFSNGVVSNISLQACSLCCCLHQFTNFVFAEWCLHVKNAAAWSSAMIDGQVKRAVSVFHFFWTVTFEFLVVIHCTSFVVSCLSRWIKCSCITIATGGVTLLYSLKGQSMIVVYLFLSLRMYLNNEFCFQVRWRIVKFFSRESNEYCI